MNDFDEYIKQGEPEQSEKSRAWLTAIGLQEVDGLKPSPYLIEAARQNIEGDITINEVKNLIDGYYKSKHVREENDRTEEADKVSARIAEILSEKTFTFSPAEYMSIHKRLFNGIYKFAGKIRDYNITKPEWVLNGETVFYASANSIRSALNHDFEREKQFPYNNASLPQTVRHITALVSDLWQIHAFGEGNTRTTAVFAIKYLRTLGFHINNDLFACHSWYFRNALVRANYNNLKNNIHADKEYLERFFENLLLSGKNLLKNKDLLIGGRIKTLPQSAKTTENAAPKCNVSILNCTLDEHLVLEFIKTNPQATQKEIAASVQKSERTVKTITKNLQQKNLLERRNGKRHGFWVLKQAADIIR